MSCECVKVLKRNIENEVNFTVVIISQYKKVSVTVYPAED